MTAGGVYMPKHFFSTENPVVLVIPWELYTKSKEIEGIEYEQIWDGEVQTLYDEAMGAAAALAVKKGIPSREINVKDIVALTVEHGAVPI